MDQYVAEHKIGEKRPSANGTSLVRRWPTTAASVGTIFGGIIVIGFSIDDTSMRLWYFSRSDAYVSEPFDFLEVRSALRYNTRTTH